MVLNYFRPLLFMRRFANLKILRQILLLPYFCNKIFLNYK